MGRDKGQGCNPKKSKFMWLAEEGKSGERKLAKENILKKRKCSMVPQSRKSNG